MNFMVFNSIISSSVRQSKWLQVTVRGYKGESCSCITLSLQLPGMSLVNYTVSFKQCSSNSKHNHTFGSVPRPSTKSVVGYIHWRMVTQWRIQLIKSTKLKINGTCLSSFAELFSLRWQWAWVVMIWVFRPKKYKECDRDVQEKVNNISDGGDERVKFFRFYIPFMFIFDNGSLKMRVRWTDFWALPPSIVIVVSLHVSC